ncbi:pyocin S6 family toxin immunity protein [Pseudomonas atagonensis]|uniref:pyocin S6 family toxin immunity protein n=1 Tax=Pseudomonas atagonensis TaxID=2609964 RepID=UPI00140E4BD2|nr:pyocin S6 family toxin immunity protein [Pseudomonas atagonensis]
MFLWISGFLKDDAEDDSLKYELIVKPQFEAAVMAVLGWKNLDESPDGEWLLTETQTLEIAKELNEQIPTELDLFMGVRG